MAEPAAIPEPAPGEVWLEGFWREAGLRLAQRWHIIFAIGLLAGLAGMPADFSSMEGGRLTAGLAARGVMMAYFAAMIVLWATARRWIARHYQALMQGAVYVTGGAFIVMGAMSGEPDSWYFMGLLEVALPAATFFFLTRAQMAISVLLTFGGYVACMAALSDSDPVAAEGLVNVTSTLFIVGILTLLIHTTVLTNSMLNYRQRLDLKASEQRITSILQSITDAFFALDTRWRFTYFNPEADRLLTRMGRPKEALLGRSIWDEFPNLAADSRMHERFVHAMRNNEPVTFEEYYPLMDADLEIHAYPSAEGLSVYAHDISDRKAAENALRRAKEGLEVRVAERTAQLRELTAHLETVVESERTRISREIHDELGQIVSVLRMELVRLARRVGKDDPQIVEQLATMEDLVNETIRSVRRIAAELRPPVLDDLGLAAAVEWFCGNVDGRTALEVVCDVQPYDMELDPDRSTALFRILQEAVTNVIRHAEAGRVWVRLAQDGGTVSLTVRDDGKGVDATIKGGDGRRGLGLVGLRERALQFGGSVQITGPAGGGTTVAVVIPDGRGRGPGPPAAAGPGRSGAL